MGRGSGAAPVELGEQEQRSDWRIIDEIRFHRSHRQSLFASGRVAKISCLDCDFVSEGDYRTVADEWNAHLPAG